MEIEKLFENTRDVLIIASQYGDTKDVLKVCVQKCKSDSDYLYKRTTCLYESLDDAVLRVAKDIKSADCIIFEDEITANELMKYFSLDAKKVYLFFENIVSEILPAEKIALLKGNKTVADVYGLIFDEITSGGDIPELFTEVEKCRRSTNALIRYHNLHSNALKLKNKHSGYIEYIRELIKNDDNVAVLYFVNKKGIESLSGAKPDVDGLPGERFFATDCKNNISSKELILDFLENIKTVIIFDENEKEIMEYLKDIFEDNPFNFEVINLFKFANEMFVNVPDGLSVLNYYLLSFDVLYGCFWDKFDRLSDYHTLLRCMLAHYENIVKKL